MSDASTQTECSFPSTNKEFSCQAPEIYSIEANVYGVEMDHCYTQKKVIQTSTPSKKNVIRDGNLSFLENLSVISSPSKSVNDQKDSDYVPEAELATTLSDSETCSTFDNEHDKPPLFVKKFVVFESHIDMLLTASRISCKVCGSPCVRFIKCYQGTMISIKYFCTVGHLGYQWNSQPLVGKLPLFNLLFSASIFFSGKFLPFV